MERQGVADFVVREVTGREVGVRMSRQGLG